MFSNNFRYVYSLIFALLFGQTLHAQNLWGSGYYQGQMICPYETKTSKAAVSMSDEEKEERRKITALKGELKLKQLERKRAETEVEYLRKKLDRHFDSAVLEFLLDTHIEGTKKCEDYRTFHARCNPQPVVQAVTASADASRPADQAGSAVVTQRTVVPALSAEDKTFCEGLVEPPEILAKKWNTKDATGKGAYCAGGSGPKSGGLVNTSICSDASLRPSDSPKYRTYNTSECASALNNYRKKKLELSNAADKEERISEEISDRTYAIADARERAKIEREYRQALTESDCEDCVRQSSGYSYEKPKRDWFSTIANVVGGGLLIGFGKKAEDASNEWHAQAGIPSQQSYGYPFYQAGISGIINGLVGPGAYGCSAGPGGAGFPYGAGGGWNLGGAANGAYGPFAGLGGAFGYPQSMYGSPWGGGAFNPGFGLNGQMNGPFGGINIGGQFGFPNNGNMAMCFTFPCNIGGGGQFGSPFGNPMFGGQLGLGGQFGNPLLGGQFGNPLMGNPQLGFNGGLSAQYQLQMLQQQQQMQMQYFQQQQQYYQMQMQQQQQAMQVYYQRQQQSIQIQQQIQQLTIQLQQLQYQSYYGAGGSLGGVGGAGFNFGGNFNFGIGVGVGTGGAPVPGGFPGGGTMYPGGTPGFYNPGGPGGVPGGGTTFPGTGGTRGR